MVQKIQGFVIIVIFFKISFGNCQEFVYTSLDGNEITIVKDERGCKIRTKNSDVIEIDNLCNTKIDANLKLVSTAIHIDFPFDYLTNKGGKIVKKDGDLYVRYIGEVSILRKKFENIFMVDYYRKTLYKSNYKAFYDKNIGLVAFSKTISVGSVPQFWLLNTKYGFGYQSKGSELE